MNAVRRTPSRSMALLLSLLAALALAPGAEAQYFGRNKVQWKRFRFRVLTTDHFEVYYYPDQNQAAADAGRMAERWYARLSKLFDHQFKSRKPIILYDNPADFQTTTVVGGLIGEGVGGFTEPVKSRLVMPLTGDYAETDHVIGHEMVHEFQYDIGETSNAVQAGGLERLPLWMVEGQAEYLSLGRRDAQTAMWLRDAAIHDDLPTLKKLNTDPHFFPYRWGEAFWAYVGGRWGDEAGIKLFLTAMRAGPEAAIKNILSLTPDQLFKDWQADIKRDYDPIIAAHKPAQGVAHPVFGSKREMDVLDLAPSLSPDGSRLAFLSTRGLFSFDLYFGDARTGAGLEKVASSSGNRHFDSLRFIDSSGSWSPDGKKFAFVVLEKGVDRIAIADAARRRIERRIRVPGINSITNPAWSPDGKRIAFSASVEAVTALWVLDLASGKATRVTEGGHADFQPSWSPDGKTIAFASDRGAGTDLADLIYGPMQIALLDVDSGNLRALPIFPGPAKHINPQFAPDGASIYFVSDPDGISNVYRYFLADGRVVRITDEVVGVAGITPLSPCLSVAAKSGDVTFTAFQKTRQVLYDVPEGQAEGTVAPSGAPVDRTAEDLPPVAQAGKGEVEQYLAQSEVGLPPVQSYPSTPYRPRLSLDFVGAPTVGAATDRYGFGVGGGGAVFFSDLLGRHQLGVALQGQASSGPFGNNIAFQSTYLNQSSRTGWGVLASHVPFLTGFTTVGVDTSTGNLAVTQVIQRVTVDQAGGVAFYPLSTTQRFEGNLVFSRYGFQQQAQTAEFDANGNLVSDVVQGLPSPPNLNLVDTSVAFVDDTSNWGFASPIQGTRLRLEVGNTAGTLGFRTALADFRHYSFVNPVTFAFRGLHVGRYGGSAEDPSLFPLFLGDETLVRGYRIDSFNTSECVTPGAQPGTCPVFDRLFGSRLAVANFEVRVPVLGTKELGLVDFPYLPLEVAAFVDTGVAWTKEQSPTLSLARDSSARTAVASAGGAIRIVLGGVIPIEVYYAIPFQRPDQHGLWGFLITPGW